MTEQMDNHIADRCVAGLKAEYNVSDENGNALRQAIIEHLGLKRANADQLKIDESSRLMDEITDRIKENKK